MRRFFESLVGRRWLAWTVLALAIVVIVLSSLTVWVKRQALDTDNWVNVSGQLLENEEVRRVVASDLTEALFTNTDVEAQLQRALPPRFEGYAGPATGLLRQAAYTSALELLGRPAVQVLWKDANRRAHRSLVAILDGKTDGLLSADEGRRRARPAPAGGRARPAHRRAGDAAGRRGARSRCCARISSAPPRTA